MLLNEILPGSKLDLRITLSGQTLEFASETVPLPTDDKKLMKQIHAATGGAPFLLAKAIRKDDKIVGLPKTGVLYQLTVVNGDTGKPYMWNALGVRLIRIPDQDAYHLFYSTQNVKEQNRRERYRLWMGLDGVVTIGLDHVALPCVIKDLSSIGIAFVIRNDLLDQHELTLHPSDLVVLTFFDEPSGTNFRLTGLVVRQIPSDEMRTMVGCKFSEENHLVAQFVNKRQRERLKEQRHAPGMAPPENKN